MLGRTLSGLTPTVISPDTDYPIYVIDLSSNNVSTITQVMLNTTSNALGVKISTSQTALGTIYEHYAAGTIDTSGIEWSLNNNALTVYTDITATDDQDYQIVLIGTRNPLPIVSLNDTLDVAPEDLELFVNYAIREAAQISGKVVPPAIEQNILELEGV